ncbi:hypothetical protein AAHC03_09673 [Spirometra sp. Aus1]
MLRWRPLIEVSFKLEIRFHKSNLSTEDIRLILPCKSNPDPSWLSINDSEEIIKTKQTEVASSELLTAIRQPWLFRQPAEADQHPVESGEYERVRLHQTGVDRPRSAACSATAPPPVDSAVVIVALPREVAVMPHLQAETTCQDAEGSRDCPGAVST